MALVAPVAWEQQPHGERRSSNFLEKTARAITAMRRLRETNSCDSKWNGSALVVVVVESALSESRRKQLQLSFPSRNTIGRREYNCFRIHESTSSLIPTTPHRRLRLFTLLSRSGCWISTEPSIAHSFFGCRIGKRLKANSSALTEKRLTWINFKNNHHFQSQDQTAT